MAEPSPAGSRDGRAIGRLRWPVTIAQRTQTASTSTTSIDETLINPISTMADITPISAATFYASEQVETPVTHRITMRWMPGIDTTYVVVRAVGRPDGTTVTEVFRLRRQLEDDGRFRFMVFEAELEKRS